MGRTDRLERIALVPVLVVVAARTVLELAVAGRYGWHRDELYYAVVAETYADARRGELILYEGSYGHYGIAINGGSAAALTESAAGDEVRIAPAA